MMNVKNSMVKQQRHPGMDCRDPDCMDANGASAFLISRLPWHWIPAVPAGMTGLF
jgi:hypothetical protein